MDRHVLLHMKEQMKPDQIVVDELMKKIEQMQDEDTKKKKRLYSPGKIVATASLVIILIIGIMSTTPGKTMAKTIKSWFMPQMIEESIEGYPETVEMQPAAQQNQKEKMADYVIYINKEIFETQTKDGVQTITGIDNPQAKMTIYQEEDIHVDECLEKIKQETGRNVFEQAEALNIEAEYQGILITEGEKWNDIIKRIYCIDNGQGGCFVIIYSHTVEADEGFGSRFRSMLNTFQIIDMKEE